MRAALVIALLWAAPVSAQEFFTLKGHGGPIMDIDVSASGQIATASFDNSVGLWDGEVPVWQEGHRAAVNVVTFWGDQVISAGDDNTVRTWPGGEILGEHTAKVVELATSETHVASASWDARIGLWSKDGQGVFLSGHRQGVNSVVFSQDGKTLYSASVDGTIRIWDVDTGEEKQLLAKHGFGINKLILNEADGWLAYGASDGGTRIIDPVTAEQIADFTLDRRPILSLAYDGLQNLAVGDGHGFIMVIDTSQMAITRDFRAAAKGPIWALAFSPDGQNIHAGGIEDILYSWPVATLTEHGQMSGATRSFLEDPETLPNGERQFKRKCSICHTLTGGSARKAGPSLHKLFGRRAGTVPDYAYSDILQGSEIVWS
ncbi:unnamed protein product, partial [Ectocarpus sp. 12 AP-2014]